MDYLEALRDVRKKRGLTQKEVGEAVGHTAHYIHQIETGKSRLSYELAVRLAYVLEIDFPIEDNDPLDTLGKPITEKIRVIRRLRMMALRSLRSCISRDITQSIIYFTSIVDREVRLADGFILLLKERNLTCAGAVLRLLLDNCMRTYAYTLAEDKEALVKRVLKPDGNLGSLRDKDGLRLTDKYLVQKLSRLDETTGSVYGHTSGYIHHSSKAFYNITSLGGSRNLSFNIGGPLTEEWDATLLECADAFIRYLALNNRLVLDAIADIPLDGTNDDSTIVNK